MGLGFTVTYARCEFIETSTLAAAGYSVRRVWINFAERLPLMLELGQA